MELFEGGRTDRNQRCSPQTAQLKLRDKFPSFEKCWLSVKQVDFHSFKIICYIQNFSLKAFSVDLQRLLKTTLVKRMKI